MGKALPLPTTNTGETGDRRQEGTETETGDRDRRHFSPLSLLPAPLLPLSHLPSPISPSPYSPYS